MSDMSVRLGTWSRLPEVVRRPTGITEHLRWLFAGMALVALFLSVPAAAVESSGTFMIVVLVIATVELTASCVYVYLRGSVPLWLDIVDAVMVAGFALASPAPATIVGFVFIAVWFRGLYGSLWRVMALCSISAAAVSLPVPVWQLIPGHTEPPATEGLFGSLPLLFVVAAIARQLSRSSQGREQSIRRDTALSGFGSKLLAVNDTVAIQKLAWTAAEEICAATPGLRILRLVRDGSALRTDGAIGQFRNVPDTFGAGLVGSDARDGPCIVDPAPLDAAAGATMKWTCVSLIEQVDDAWLVVGVPRRVPSEAILSVQGLANQLALALRNSDVHQQLTAQALTDSLTGLDNRASFTAGLTASLARGARRRGLHILFLDLDDFKDVNDVLGHRAGDDLLIEVAARLRMCTRPDDVCARLGGDEFAVVLHGSTDAAAAEVAQRMVDLVSEPVQVGGSTARVGVSIGIASAVPGISVEDLVHQADVAMYAAKANGKGRVQSFITDLLQVDRDRVSFEWQLAAAAASGELIPHYQPILALPGLNCVGMEALVRWQRADGSLLIPEEFLDAAERTGSIVDIGAFVLRNACADASAWLEAFPGADLAVHINVSAPELEHDGFLDLVRDCLAETGIPSDRLVLEVAETAALNSPVTIDRLKALSELGVRIALDDFGTGYSSLSTLRALPVSFVKLDASFISGSLMNSVDRTLLNAIVQMSNQLGIDTIAEGVERPEQQDFLNEIGTDAAQGFLYARPFPAGEMAAWLHENLGAATASDATVTQIRPRDTA